MFRTAARQLSSLSLLLLFVFVSPARAAIPVDVSAVACDVQASDTIRMRHLTAPSTPEYPGPWWVDFRWDPDALVFVPIALGPEAAPTGHTWSWIVTSWSSAFRYSVTSNPEARTLQVSYQQTSGTPWLCEQEDFLQGSNAFSLVPLLIMVNNAKALITYTSAFDGCGSLYAGQTIEATISHLPAWFDFSQAFGVGFGAAPIYCEPDGSIHP